MHEDNNEDEQAEPLCYIDGQVINIASMDEAVSAAIGRAEKGAGFTFFTLNLDHLAKRRERADFRQAYDRATLVSADGAPLVWLGRSIGVHFERTTGADMVRPMAAASAGAGLKVFLFGSNESVLATTAERLTAEFPGLVIAGMEAPPMGFEPTSEAAEAAADRIAASGARICFVALGAPKQELFADMALKRHPQLGLFCIGAALDFIAGAQSRAPLFIANHGLEWLWRLSQNPKRMANRYWKSAKMLAWLMVPWQLERLVDAGRYNPHRPQPLPAHGKATAPAVPPRPDMAGLARGTASDVAHDDKSSDRAS